MCPDVYLQLVNGYRATFYFISKLAIPAGGIMAQLEMWKMGVIPILLNNVGTWDEVNEKTFKKLNDLQNTLLRYLLLTPRTTPLPAMCWDFASLPIEYRITKLKLNLIHHIATLDDDALAKEMFETQKQFNLSGLVQDCNDEIKNLDYPDTL